MKHRSLKTGEGRRFKNPPGFGPGSFIELKLGTGQTEVPAQYYYRPCPYEEIMAKDL